MALEKAAESQLTEPVVAEAKTFQVVSLSGSKASVPCDKTDTLKDLADKAVAGLGLDAPDGIHFLANGKPVSDVAAVTQMLEEAECLELQVIVKGPSEWFAGHKFSYRSMRGRRCGMQEDESSSSLSLHADGSFTYECKSHYHDYDSDFKCSGDTHITATGSWYCTEDGKSVVLTGSQHETTDNRESHLNTSGSDSDDEGGAYRERWRDNNRHSERDSDMKMTFSREKLSGADWKREPLKASESAES
mmetsp:Transcript_12065/g.22144  ORF Transcript_12065/g.22144 Transcript_12065/m.22144 type:complete len:247 (-) Transcript_12065:147-887(-)